MDLARWQQHQAALLAREEAHLEARQRQEAFHAEVAANRARIAAGERIVKGSVLALIDQAYQESQAQQNAQMQQMQRQQAQSTHGWNAQGMHMPPHIQAAEKRAYFDALNAEYADLYGQQE